MNTIGQGRMPCSQWRGLAALLLVWGSMFAGVSCTKPEAGTIPDKYERGATLFAANCARCHGERGLGTDSGPPLVHKIYEPNHHPDVAFQRAAAEGVQAHHWKFGNMPRIDAVGPSEVEQIIGYVRWLQREAGIH